MRPLPLRPLPIPYEPISDFLARLGNANGYDEAELWSILDRGDSPHEQVLSDALNGHSLPPFSGPANRRVNIPVELFGLRTADFTNVYRRWCPLCIGDAAWLRPIWRLKVATVCSIHKVRLLQTCPGCGEWVRIQTILHGTCECGMRFAQAVVPVVGKQVQLARALSASLKGKATLALESASVVLTTAHFVRMICYTGRFIEGPPLTRPGQVPNLENFGMACRLFDGTALLLGDWPNMFWHCLELYMHASPSDASVRRVFGSLYRVIYHNLRAPEFQFLRDAFELFLLDHWRGELCGRHRLFRQETTQGHRHQGLARVSRATGLGSETLKRMVHQDWLPASRFTASPKRQLITIDKAQLPQFIPSPGDYFDLRRAARLLGIKHTRLRQLVAGGVVLADAKPDWSKNNRWYFRQNELNKFMDQIRQFSQSCTLQAATVTLNHVLRYWRITPAVLCTLLRAVSQGEVPFAIAVQAKLRDMVFPEMELRDWLDQQRKATTDWVSVVAAASSLGLKEEVVYELVSKNLLVADLTPKNGRMFKRISLHSLERFQAEYVSLAELARLRKTSASALLKQISVPPVTGPKVDGGRQYFYRRGEVPDHTLFAAMQ